MEPKELSEEQTLIMQKTQDISLSIERGDYTKALAVTDSMRVLIYEEFWINQDWSLGTVEIAKLTGKHSTYVSKKRRMYAPETLKNMGRNKPI